MSELYSENSTFLLMRNDKGVVAQPHSYNKTKPIGILLPVYACPYIKARRKDSANVFTDTIQKLWVAYQGEEDDPEPTIKIIAWKTGLDPVFIRSVINSYLSGKDLKTGKIEANEFKRVYLFYDILGKYFLNSYLRQWFFEEYSDFEKVCVSDEGIFLTVNEVRNITEGPFYPVTDESNAVESIPDPSRALLSRILLKSERIQGKELPFPVFLACKCFVPDGFPDTVHIEYPWPNGDVILPKHLEELLDGTHPENNAAADALRYMKESAKRSMMIKRKDDPFQKNVAARFPGIAANSTLCKHMVELERCKEKYLKAKENGTTEKQKEGRSEMVFLIHSVIESALIAAYQKRKNPGSVPRLVNGLENDPNKKDVIVKMLDMTDFYPLADNTDEKKQSVEFLMKAGNIKASYNNYVPSVNESFLAVMGAACDNPASTPLSDIANSPKCRSLIPMLEKSLTERNEGRAHKNIGIEDKYIPDHEEIMRRYDIACVLISTLVVSETDAKQEETELVSTVSEEKILESLQQYPALMRRPSNDIRENVIKVCGDFEIQYVYYYSDALTLLKTIMLSLISPKYTEGDGELVQNFFNDRSIPQELLKGHNKMLVSNILSKYGHYENWNDNPNMAKIRTGDSGIDRLSAHSLFYIAAALFDSKCPDYLRKILSDIPNLHTLINECSLGRKHSETTNFKDHYTEIENFHRQLLDCTEQTCLFLENYKN